MKINAIIMQMKKFDRDGLYLHSLKKNSCRLINPGYFGYFLVLCLLLLGLNGCSLKEPPVLMKMAPLPGDGRICEVAVLPFANQTRYVGGGALMTRVFTSELIRSEIGQVALEGDVRKILMQLRVLPGQTPNIDHLKALADRLGVQLVIIGEIMEMRDKDKYGRRLDPVLSVIVRIVDADSGRTFWTTYLGREGKDYQKIMHWGLESTITGLSERVTSEIITAWRDGGLRKCEK